MTSGLGYVPWYAALPALSATSAATIQLSVPAIAAIGGATLLAEPITLRLLLGLGGGPGRHRAYDTEEGLKKIMFEVAERLRNIKVSAPPP